MAGTPRPVRVGNSRGSPAAGSIRTDGNRPGGPSQTISPLTVTDGFSRFLLGCLLRLSFAAPQLLAVDDRGAPEAPLVRRPLDGDLGVHHLAARVGEQLLQVRLVVDARGERVLDLVGEGVDDRILDGGEAVLELERKSAGRAAAHRPARR